MTHIRTSLAALVFSFIALPALAGGFVMDFPRLTYPASDSHMTHSRAAIPAPGKPATRTPVAK